MHIIRQLARACGFIICYLPFMLLLLSLHSGGSSPPLSCKALVLCCLNLIHVMAKDWAKSFYRSQAWQAIRLRALMRDGYTCRVCGARATEIDHIIELTPENISNQDISLNLANLQSLCHDCHTRKTKADKYIYAGGDCPPEFFFDADGNLTPRPAQ